MKRGQSVTDARYWLTAKGWLATGGLPEEFDEDKEAAQ